MSGENPFNHEIADVTKKAKTLDFEAAMKELEGIVAHMEAGELSLEDSLKQFERGIELTRTCQQALTAAEQKVQILVARNGQETLEPFTAPE